MNLKKIVEILDEKFNIKNFSPDMPFSKLVPGLYGEKKIELDRYFTKNYLISFHGLIFENGEEVKKIYLAVFLNEEILDKIFEREEKDILIFTHHPLDMETTGRGFLPLDEKYLKEMKKRNISAYGLHTPLDVNEEIATSPAIANVLNLKNKQKFAEHSIGFAGVIGDLEKEIPFEEFIKRTLNVFDISKANYVKNSDVVSKIAVIAGGGSYVDLIIKARELGCDTYLTGDYINKIDNEYAKGQRNEFNEALPKLKINLVECSHYATEKIVLINEMKNFFENLQIDCEFIAQDNPWK